MNRRAFFFDGFNIYHSLKDNLNYHKYKWLDYYALAKAFVTKKDEIVCVNYFTAYRTWKDDSYRKHRDYVEALKTRGVNVILGKFKTVSKYCKICNQVSRNYHEEKQTDVNIAIYLLKGALLNEYDTAILATADSDIVPAIRMIHSIPSPKIVKILLPIGKKSYDLENEAYSTMKIKEKHLMNSQLPDEIIVGGKVLSCPAEWK